MLQQNVNVMSDAEIAKEWEKIHKAREDAQNQYFHQLELERIKNATDVTEKMMPLEKLFYFWTAKQGEVYNFFNSKIGNKYRATMGLLGHYTGINKLSPEQMGEFVAALEKMATTNGASMVEFLSKKSEFTLRLADNLYRLMPVLEDFQTYQEKEVENELFSNEETCQQNFAGEKEFSMDKPMFLTWKNEIGKTTAQFDEDLTQSVLDRTKLKF